MENLITRFHPTHFLQEGGSYYVERKCVICEKEISPPSNWGSPPSDYLYCRSCDLYFHKACPTSLMEKLTINFPETHEHTLTFIRKKNCFNCDACGRVDMDEWMKMMHGDHGTYEMNMYACLPCNFFIHRDCIYLPKVIKLTLHSHRLFHIFQVASYNTRCRLCYNSFGCGSGGYICIDETCYYILHSHCATKKELWDGRDVEGEPEETSNSEDVTSLKEVDGKTFHHFSHQHDLTRLCVNGEEEEEEGDERVCQACILPVDFDSFLGCKECNFALHDTCANLPRKVEHTFHRHPLTLEVDMTNIKEGFFSCSKCERESCGFMYRCCQEECDFKMDAKCASLANPVYNKAHQHPLTLFDNGARCLKCPRGARPRFYLDSKTATLPVMVKNKYDTHPLSLCISKSDVEIPSSLLRCEICEIRINTGYPDYHDLYGCFDCNTVVHAECAIGKYPYLKPGRTIKLNGFEIEIASNSISRPICHACHSTCQDKLVFKDKSSAISFCSINCITSSNKTLMQSYGV